MKRLLLVGLLVVSSACAIPVSIGGRSTAQLTAPGVQALHAVEVVKALDVIRDTAVDAEAAKIVPAVTATLVVKAHKSIIAVIRAGQAGWKASVLESLAQLKRDLPAKDAVQFVPYIDAATGLIKAVIA